MNLDDDLLAEAITILLRQRDEGRELSWEWGDWAVHVAERYDASEATLAWAREQVAEEIARAKSPR